MSRSSLSTSPSSTLITESSAQSYRHYYAKLDFDARAPPASALPIPRCLQQSYSTPSSNEEGHQRETSLNVATKKSETEKRDTGQPSLEDVVVSSSTQEVAKSISTISKEGVYGNQVEVKECHKTHSREVAERRDKQQQVTASRDHRVMGWHHVPVQKRHSQQRDWVMGQRLKLYNIWVEMEVTLLHLTARLERVTANIAQLEAMESTEASDEAYAST